ncbi:MAG: thiamine pyrophosphate-dependent enzyme [bacterium]
MNKVSPKKFDLYNAQQKRNIDLISGSRYMRNKVVSRILPFSININRTGKLQKDEINILNGLGIKAAKIAIRSLESLAKIKELDHLGGGLDLIPAFMMTLAVTDNDKMAYTIEHAHTSIGYYSGLAALGYLNEKTVIDKFRRSLDIPGHVSTVPGGTELNGGRLGVMIPAAVGQALGLKAKKGKGAWVVCHCGDAGWISGQALNGFNGADLHKAPITFIMHRNGIQLSGSNKSIMDKDPRPIIEAMGIKIIEVPSLSDPAVLYGAYKKANELAGKGIPNMIYPVGYKSSDKKKITLATFAQKYGIKKEVKEFAGKNKVSMDREIWIPGCLMSYRDVVPMMECLFLVNDLPGGEGHHDGHMKGRDADAVLSNPMFQMTGEEKIAMQKLEKKSPRKVISSARPKPGSRNLILKQDALIGIELPKPGKMASPRAGAEAGYAAVAKAHPDNVFVVSCDLDASTKLGKARKFLKQDHQFEMSIEEQVSAIMVNGLAVSSREPQLNIFSTFAAFFEGIAREGFEMWRYQRNLNGVNEGLNAVMHLSHVGACTGRDHFSGWSLDWINLAMSYIPYIHRFYAPADARAAFAAVRDMAAHYGAHIICIPRDNLPVLEKQNGKGALWNVDSAWESVTAYRKYSGAKRAILTVGAPSFLAAEASELLLSERKPTDVYVINGLPLAKDTLSDLIKKYSRGIVTVEDGIIGCSRSGYKGFAGMVRSNAYGTGLPLNHIGITDPRIAPSEGYMEVWEHFGITSKSITDAVKAM